MPADRKATSAAKQIERTFASVFFLRLFGFDRLHTELGGVFGSYIRAFGRASGCWRTSALASNIAPANAAPVRRTIARTATTTATTTSRRFVECEKRL